jgi:murein DD-endopeptidase MepM/ murein hydrolase activator NlpD
VKRFLQRVMTHVRARWRSFAREADASRQASLAIWSSIQARTVPGEAAADALPRLSWPVAGRVTSPFAMRHGRLHEGIDIALAAGAPVRAALEGVVLAAGELGTYGRAIVLVHGGHLATVYAHLDRVEVAVDDQVTREQQVGTGGVTGRSSGPHLHFEVRFDGTPVDPLVFLDAPPPHESAAGGAPPLTSSRT